jgi:hypothetical protein
VTIPASRGTAKGVTEAHQKLPALERAMKAVMVEKHQALLNVDTNAGAD